MPTNSKQHNSTGVRWWRNWWWWSKLCWRGRAGGETYATYLSGYSGICSLCGYGWSAICTVWPARKTRHILQRLIYMCTCSVRGNNNDKGNFLAKNVIIIGSANSWTTSYNIKLGSTWCHSSVISPNSSCIVLHQLVYWIHCYILGQCYLCDFHQ